MPALLILGFDIDVIRVMTVGVLGGLLGILMMIPLRRAFIVQKHGELKYPEGTACADVLKAGEQGGSTALTLLVGLILGFVYQFMMLGLKMWQDTASKALFWKAGGKTVGLKGAAVGCEMSAPLLGVGYIIGPRIASIMVAGGVLAYLVISPMIVFFGESSQQIIAPAVSKIDDKLGEKADIGLIANMPLKDVRNNYILYIGAGAVAAGGIFGMIKALPVIVGSVMAGFRDLRSGGRGAAGTSVPRTERDLPISWVVFGCIGMVLALASAPQLGLGLNTIGIAGAFMILIFGFLFVTVSSRLTGEIGSSSNPISGMTVATLLLTCLILLALSEAGAITISKEIKLLALTIAGVVCIASSNGGTTSQALKTGHLLGATPRLQQYAILIGSLTSALVIGFVLIYMNTAGTIYTKQKLPTARLDVSKLTAKDHVRVGEYESDKTEYHVFIRGDREKLDPSVLLEGDVAAIPPGRYLVDQDGRFVYRCDPAVNGSLAVQDSELGKPEDEQKKAAFKFDAPKTQLVAIIIDGILDQNLPWDLVIIGVLIAVTLELSGVPSLPFAVGVYLPLSSSVPIFLGGMMRWLVDLLRRRPDEGDSSPGVLLSSGYIAGGSIAAVIAAFLEFAPDETLKWLNFGEKLKDVQVFGSPFAESNGTVVIAFGLLSLALFLGAWLTGRKKTT
jgi:putative OPT family oligopeptide transporter